MLPPVVKLADLMANSLKKTPPGGKWVGWLPVFLPILLASGLLLYKLSYIAGLHRDEAVFGLFAEQILQGERPIAGFFNAYTAPIHSYIIAATFALLGESIGNLRLSGALLNLLTLVLYFDILRRLWPRIAISAVWLLATLPSFVIFSRISMENCAMNPFFLFGGIWAFVRAQESKTRWLTRTGWFGSGALLYLGCWNHAISVPTVASVGLVYLIFSRPKRKFLFQCAPWFLAGAFIAAVPRICGIVFLHLPLFPSRPTHTGPLSPLLALLNLIYTLGGNALFARMTGQVALSLNWLLPVATLAAGVVAFVPKLLPANEARLARAVVACFVLSTLGSWVITPGDQIGSRIWLLPLWFVPAILAAGLTALPQAARISCLVVLVTGNLLGVGYNYFHTFQKTGGAPNLQVYEGGRMDNSADFMDLTALADKLRSVPDVPAILIEDFNENRLWFLMPEARKRIIACDLTHLEALHPPPGSLFAIYRSPEWRDIPNGQNLSVATVQMKYRADLSTGNYVVLQIQ